MQGIYRIFAYVIIFLQACYTGLFLGQLLNLIQFQKPANWIRLLLLLIVCGLTFLFIFKKQVQQYLLKYFGFVWNHFFFLAYGGVFLILLLPLFLHFEEGGWIVSAFQFSTLLALFVLLLDQVMLQDWLHKVYANLLQIPGKYSFFNLLIWFSALLAFAFLSIWRYEGSEASMRPALSFTLYLGAAVFLLSAGLKVSLFIALRNFHHYMKGRFTLAETGSGNRLPLDNYYVLDKKAGDIILEAMPRQRALIYKTIREVPFVDKIEVLDNLQQEQIPHDIELQNTIQYLKNIRQELLDAGSFTDTDKLNNVKMLKACIRTVIQQNNSALVQKLLSDNRPELKKAAMLATVYFKDSSFIPALVNLLKEPGYAFTAREALLEWGEQCIPFLRSAKYRNSKDSFFIGQCLELVQCYKSPEAMDFLLEMLSEPQKRFQYKAALALLKHKNELSSIHRTQILYFIETLVGNIAMLREIRCELKNANSSLFTALLEEERTKKGLVLDLLQFFIPLQVWKKLRDTVEMPAQEAFSLAALIDLYFPLVLRVKCKILLLHDEDQDIAPALQAEYLQEQICFNYANEYKAIRQVLRIDYSQIGYWLRVCALKQLAQIPGQQASFRILAELFNENPLLQETAAEVLYSLNHDYYYLYMQRLPQERVKALRHTIESYMNGDQAAKPLVYHQILFLHSLPLFSNSPYEELVEYTKFFDILRIEMGEKHLQADPYQPLVYWIVNDGEFTVFYKGETLFQAGRGDVVDMSFLAQTEGNTVMIRAKSEIKIYFIEKFVLNNLYLKTGYSNIGIIQPTVNQSAKLQVA